MDCVLYMYVLFYRMLMGLVIGYVVYITPSLKTGESEFPMYFYGMIIAVYALHQVIIIIPILTIILTPYLAKNVALKLKVSGTFT